MPLSCFSLTLLCAIFFFFVRSDLLCNYYRFSLLLFPKYFFVRTYPAMPLSCFSLILPCCAIIPLYTYPAVSFFSRTYPAVPLFYFRIRYHDVPLFFFALTLLCPYLVYSVPCFALSTPAVHLFFLRT